MTGPEIDRKSEPTALGSTSYGRWRRLAARLLRGERRQHTLQPTELVHEAWLRLSGPSGEPRPSSEALALRAMQHALIDHARARRAALRDVDRTVALELEPRADEDTGGADAFRAAFERLEAMDPELARLLRLRFERGGSVEAVAQALGTSPRTVKRETRAARAWLRQALDGGQR